MHKRGFPILLFLTGMIILSSCSTTKTLQEGEYLLVKNAIEFDSVNPGIDKDELHSIIQPKPNKKFLGVVPFGIWFYNWGTKGNTNTGFKKWLREKVGSRPSVYNQIQVENSVKGLENYMEKIGYFSSKASYDLTVKKNSPKARVTYKVVPATPYRYRNITYDIADSNIKDLVSDDPSSSKVKKGLIFNAFNLDTERERMASQLTKNGYYYFDRNYIYFELDTALGTHQMDLKVRIKDYGGKTNSQGDTLHYSHYRYKINNIFIKTDYDQLVNQDSSPDTLLYTPSRKNTAHDTESYYFIYPGKLRIHPMTITQSLFLKTGSIYNSQDVRMSKLRLSEIGLYNYSNIRFREVSSGDSTGFGLLDCYVDLGRRKLHAFTVEAEGTNRG